MNWWSCVPLNIGDMWLMARNDSHAYISSTLRRKSWEKQWKTTTAILPSEPYHMTCIRCRVASIRNQIYPFYLLIKFLVTFVGEWGMGSETRKIQRYKLSRSLSPWNTFLTFNDKFSERGRDGHYGCQCWSLIVSLIQSVQSDHVF